MAKLNRTSVIEGIVAEQLKKDSDLPKFSVGDTIDVHYKIIEGDKERIQIFQGVLLADTGRGIHRMITVRRIVANEGVERTFPLHSPKIDKIEVGAIGDVRRAKLYYLRDKVGKQARVREKIQ